MDPDKIYLEKELERTRRRLERMTEALQTCVDKFERPQLICPELVAALEEEKKHAA